jgi:hypothetical protein
MWYVPNMNPAELLPANTAMGAVTLWVSEATKDRLKLYDLSVKTETDLVKVEDPWENLITLEIEESNVA